MLRLLREHGELRFGPNVLKTQRYDATAEVLTELYSQLVRESVMAANGVVGVVAPAIPVPNTDEEFRAYEFVHFYETYADYEFNPTEAGAQRVVNHTYAQRFYPSENAELWKALQLDTMRRSIQPNHYDDSSVDSRVHNFVTLK